MIEDLIRKSRSCRRFYQKTPIKLKTLEELVNLGRLSASAGNLQPLAYVLSCNVNMNEDIFSCLGWAGYLKDWPGPEEGERPTGYIIVLNDTGISKDPGCDHGIAVQSIMLGAREKGLAGCIIGSVDRDKLHKILELPDKYKILLVLALGTPKETVVIERLGPDGNICYWRDENGIHHVPKRSLDHVVVKSYK